MTLLTLNGRRIALEQFNKEDAGDFSPYELHTLRFCRQWLAGQASFVLNTSGSTSRPKAIALTRAQMSASARLTGQALGLQAGDKALVCLSTEYIAGIMMLVRGLELGLALTVSTPIRNPLLGFPDDTVFDFAAFVPLQLQEILTTTPAKKILNRMRAALVGGAPINEDLLRQIKALDAPVYHTYGMTETVSHIALRRLNGPQASEYFTPLDGVEISLNPQGCLVVQSVLTGNRTLVTHDRVELRPDGSFRWLGRIDNVINTGGFKVQVETVESALAKLLPAYPQLAGRRFFIGPLADPQFDQAVVAVIEGLPVAPEILAEIRARLRAGWLHDYEVPRYFYFQPRLLETPTGKIDRRANLAIIKNRQDAKNAKNAKVAV
jgi:O-succinylbenzoic acid--CoA ligase